MAALPELVLVEDLLDDEELSLRGITRSGIPCNVSVHRDGQEALEHLLDPTALPPTLVVLDFNLPRFSGLEIVTRMRQNEKTRCVPVVIFSGTNGGSVLTDCYVGGANSCVTKPDDPREYVSRLARITRYWLSINQPSDEIVQYPAHRMIQG